MRKKLKECLVFILVFMLLENSLQLKQEFNTVYASAKEPENSESSRIKA